MITVTLLALLVLAVFALSSLVRVGTQTAGSSAYQAQARQNALLALSVALGELQRTAGPDARVTGMAGIAGVATKSPFRQWCGVWIPGNPTPLAWLSSGATPGSMVPSVSAGLATKRLVDVGTVSGPLVDSTDQEYVDVGLVPVEGVAADGRQSVAGHFAYWVGDEGIKVSAVLSDSDVQTSPGGAKLRPNFRLLLSATFVPSAETNAKALTYEQLPLTATGISLVKGFHQLTRTSYALPSTAPLGVPRSAGYVMGAFNINTTSEAAWRAWLEFPDSISSTWGLNAARTLSAARQIRDRFSARARPFASVAELLGSNLLKDSFDNSSPKVTTVTQQEFLTQLEAILTVRSDTFRIRAYGESLSPVDQSVASAAYCEAIVQRTAEAAPAGLGRKFVVTYFRWLGPGDV